METPDLERIRFITRHFNDLQGLRYAVPLGLVLLAWTGSPLLRGAGCAGALLLALWAGRHYRSAFGAVERQPLDFDAEVYPAPIFSPAGPTPRLAMPPRATGSSSPMSRRSLPATSWSRGTSIPGFSPRRSPSMRRPSSARGRIPMAGR
jgi:hypothetical protein